MPEPTAKPASSSPVADKPQERDTLFDEFAATAARTAAWPDGTLFNFAASVETKKS